MIPLPSPPSAVLTWSKIPHTHNYELTAHGEIAGTLQHLRGMSPHFVAESEHGRWIFRRNGFLGAGAEILDSNSQQPIANFRAAWSGGGVLTFTDGAVFHMECKGLWRPVWTVTTDTGEAVLHLHSREKSVEIVGAEVPERRLSQLILFTWYRMLQAQEDAAAAAMIAS